MAVSSVVFAASAMIGSLLLSLATIGAVVIWRLFLFCREGILKLSIGRKHWTSFRTKTSCMKKYVAPYIISDEWTSWPPRGMR